MNPHAPQRTSVLKTVASTIPPCGHDLTKPQLGLIVNLIGASKAALYGEEVVDSANKTPDRQLDKFKQAARELETDDNEARFDERMKKLVKHKPVGKPE